MKSEAEDRPVISMDELLERCRTALLGGPNQRRVIYATGAVFSGRRYRRQYSGVIYLVSYPAELVCFRQAGIRSIFFAAAESVQHDQRDIVFATLASSEVLDCSQHRKEHDARLTTGKCPRGIQQAFGSEFNPRFIPALWYSVGV